MVRKKKKNLGTSGQHFQKKNIRRQHSKSSLNKIIQLRTKWGEEMDRHSWQGWDHKNKGNGGGQLGRREQGLVGLRKPSTWKGQREGRAAFSKNTQLLSKKSCRIQRVSHKEVTENTVVPTLGQPEDRAQKVDQVELEQRFLSLFYRDPHKETDLTSQWRNLVQKYVHTNVLGK